MKVPRVLPVSLSLLIAVGLARPSFCSDGPLVRADKSAADAYSHGEYKRAQGQWNKLLERLNFDVARSEETKSLNEQIESTLRHLGECALAQRDYDKADDYLGQAKAAAASLHETDGELDKDFKDLAANYRQIDLANLGSLGIVGPLVTIGLRDFRPTKISVSKADNGHHVSVFLADDAIKDIGSKSVTQVGVSKNMSFDLIEGEGGVVTLANIVGVKVHAGFWVNIINSSLKLDESKHPVALVTAQKMGISQSVSTPVPDMIYLPVLGIVSQVKALFGEPGSQSEAVVAAPTNGPASATSGDSPKGSSTISQVEGTGVVPVTNSFAVTGAIVPLPTAPPQADVGTPNQITGSSPSSGPNRPQPMPDGPALGLPTLPLPAAPVKAEKVPVEPVPPLVEAAPINTPNPEHAN